MKSMCVPIIGGRSERSRHRFCIDKFEVIGSCPEVQKSYSRRVDLRYSVACGRKDCDQTAENDLPESTSFQDRNRENVQPAQIPCSLPRHKPFLSEAMWAALPLAWSFGPGRH